jgi:hypothetical protein
MPVNNFNYAVSWSDFAERPARPTGENEDAQIHPEMSFSNFQIGRKGKAIIIKDVDIDIALVAVDCWVVTSQKSAYLLKHEQGHFDILAICARELYNTILGLSGTSTNDLQKKIEQAKTRLGQKVTLVDKRYDDKTKHSLDTAVQQTWDGKIDSTKKNPTGSLDDLPG